MARGAPQPLAEANLVARKSGGFGTSSNANSGRSGALSNYQIFVKPA